MEKDMAIKAFFDERALNWDVKCNYESDKVSAIVTLAQVKKGKRILDIACGTGVLFRELLSRTPREVAGVDLSDKMIEIAGRKCSDSRICLWAGDFFKYEGKGFDVAIIYNAYPHFMHKEVLAGHVYNCLAEGGRFMVAHSEGRRGINCHHNKPGVQEVSTKLRPVAEEIEAWKRLFEIDVTADNEDIYFFSGVKM